MLSCLLQALPEQLHLLVQAYSPTPNLAQNRPFSSAKTPFPFMTWEDFTRKFQLQFIEENKQDHALHKLESRSYHMGSRDIFWYTDDFEDLMDLASFKDLLIKVTKYRTGLNPVINLAITVSSDPPNL